jgi:hypothetical protein
MNNSGDAAEQIVRMSLEGVEVAARISGSAAKEIALFLIAALKNKDKNHLKLKGKARLTSMLKSGKALEIISLKERDLAKFAQGAKEYGIVYCVLRNKKNKPDGLCDIMVKAEDAPKISRLVERFKFATVDKAKIKSEIIADKNEKANGSEPEAPEVNNIENLLDEIFGTAEGKVKPDTPEIEKTEPVKDGKEQTDYSAFFTSDPPTHPPSEITSDSRKKPERATSSKKSVKEEIREITVAKKEKELERPEREEPVKAKTPATTKHKQPRRGKSKSKKTKGDR